MLFQVIFLKCLIYLVKFFLIFIIDKFYMPHLEIYQIYGIYTYDSAIRGGDIIDISVFVDRGITSCYPIHVRFVNLLKYIIFGSIKSLLTISNSQAGSCHIPNVSIFDN